MSAAAMAVMSRSLKTMLPSVGCRNLVSRLKQVVLPAPFGPMSAWMLPRATSRFDAADRLKSARTAW